MHLGASELSPLYYNPFKKEFRQSQFEPDPRHKEKTDWKEKVTFGGTMSVNFGTFTFVLLNPQII